MTKPDIKRTPMSAQATSDHADPTDGLACPEPKAGLFESLKNVWKRRQQWKNRSFLDDSVALDFDRTHGESNGRVLAEVCKDLSKNRPIKAGN